jgi:hypothetical protein
MGITAVVKHHYCCFGSLLNKVIQVEGRKQLGINFGSGKNTDCRGLTLAEIMRLDFDKMDFSEFFIDILKRMKIPKIGDISSRVNSSLPNIRKYDGNPNNKKNNMTGWNADVKDDSWEAEEEKRQDSPPPPSRASRSQLSSAAPSTSKSASAVTPSATIDLDPDAVWNSRKSDIHLADALRRKIRNVAPLH